jgi:hypothetical protein
MPTAVGSCEITIRNAAAEVKPISTGCDIREATEPNLKNPIPMWPVPTISVNSAAKPIYTGLPGVASGLSALNVSSDVKATGSV